MKVPLSVRLIRISAVLFGVAFVALSHDPLGRFLQWAGTGTMWLALLLFCRDKLYRR
jgi:hypothetical protein